jgi:hypothetical protein
MFFLNIFIFKMNLMLLIRKPCCKSLACFRHPITLFAGYQPADLAQAKFCTTHGCLDKLVPGGGKYQLREIGLSTFQDYEPVVGEAVVNIQYEKIGVFR